MSKYKFNIDNYHAIGHADIEIGVSQLSWEAMAVEKALCPVGCIISSIHCLC